jgi:hypothetical protein
MPACCSSKPRGECIAWARWRWWRKVYSAGVKSIVPQRSGEAMERPEIERILSGAERTLANGEKVDLRRLGFWRAVEAVKEHREWTEAYADRISVIDREVGPKRGSTSPDRPLIDVAHRAQLPSRRSPSCHESVR